MVDSERMCTRVTCERRGQPTATKRCELCGYVTAPWDQAKSETLRAPKPVPSKPIAKDDPDFQDSLSVLKNWIVLGGYGSGLAAQTLATLAFETTTVRILGSDAVVSVPYEQVEALEVTSELVETDSSDGPVGAFLAGGLIGGMEVRRLNALLASSSRITVVRLESRSLELFLTRPDALALDVRIGLSEVLGLVRAAARREAPQAFS